jgi:hypothetical protein
MSLLPEGWEKGIVYAALRVGEGVQLFEETDFNEF